MRSASDAIEGLRERGGRESGAVPNSQSGKGCVAEEAGFGRAVTLVCGRAAGWAWREWWCVRRAEFFQVA